MSSNQHICRTRYTQGRPFVRAKVAIINEMTGKQTTIDKNFKVDTGFDAGIHLPEVHMSDAHLVGLEPTLGTVGLAGGVEKPAHYSFAYLKEIEGYEFPALGIGVQLVL